MRALRDVDVSVQQWSPVLGTVVETVSADGLIFHHNTALIREHFV